MKWKRACDLIKHSRESQVITAPNSAAGRIVLFFILKFQKGSETENVADILETLSGEDDEVAAGPLELLSRTIRRLSKVDKFLAKQDLQYTKLYAAFFTLF